MVFLVFGSYVFPPDINPLPCFIGFNPAGGLLTGGGAYSSQLVQCFLALRRALALEVQLIRSRTLHSMQLRQIVRAHEYCPSTLCMPA